jgi:hypothetical protein
MGISAQASRGSKPTSVLAGEPAHEQSPGASLRTATSGGEKLIQPAHAFSGRTRDPVPAQGAGKIDPDLGVGADQASLKDCPDVVDLQVRTFEPFKEPARWPPWMPAANGRRP